MSDTRTWPPPKIKRIGLREWTRAMHDTTSAVLANESADPITGHVWFFQWRGLLVTWGRKGSK